jgi:hypothetical protein
MIGLKVTYEVKEVKDDKIFNGTLSFPKTTKENSLEIIEKLMMTLEMKRQAIEENV